MTNLAYTITDRSIVFMIDGRTYTVNRGDDKYDDIRSAIRNEDWDEVPRLMDIKGTLVSDSNGGLYLINGKLHCENYPVPGLLGSRIIKMFREGFSVKPLSRFLENLMENPSDRSRQELYGFIEACDLPITEDGHFLAYKMVTEDFKDIYTRTMDNSIGAIVSMPRENVDDNKHQTCSRGLHFCSEGYLGRYGTRNSSQIVILKINPRDVVSIPTDYNNAKGRACQYEVVDALSWDDRITPDFTDEYSDPDDIDPYGDWDDEDDWDNSPVTSSDERWEVRDRIDGNLFASYETRSDARDHRNQNPTNWFIWDSLTQTVEAGSPLMEALPTYKSNSSAVLTEADVREIRQRLRDEDYDTLVGLASDYGVSDRTIRRIRDNESWVGV